MKNLALTYPSKLGISQTVLWTKENAAHPCHKLSAIRKNETHSAIGIPVASGLLELKTNFSKASVCLTEEIAVGRTYDINSHLNKVEAEHNGRKPDETVSERIHS